jgi:hypothetical protein
MPVDPRNAARMRCSVPNWQRPPGPRDRKLSNGQKIDTRGSGVPPIFEWQIASDGKPFR